MRKSGMRAKSVAKAPAQKPKPGNWDYVSPQDWRQIKQAERGPRYSLESVREELLGKGK